MSDTTDQIEQQPEYVIRRELCVLEPYGPKRGVRVVMKKALAWDRAEIEDSAPSFHSVLRAHVNARRGKVAQPPSVTLPSAEIRALAEALAAHTIRVAGASTEADVEGEITRVLWGQMTPAQIVTCYGLWYSHMLMDDYALNPAQIAEAMQRGEQERQDEAGE